MYLGWGGFFGDTIGTASKSQKSGKIDAAFIPFENQSGWDITPYAKNDSTTFENIKLGTENHIEEGAQVMKIGGRTGITRGYIKHKWFYRYYENQESGTRDVIFDSMTFTNEGEEGDSGGPLYREANGNLYLIGMVYGGFEDEVNINANGKGLACRISNVMEEFDITPITNDNYSDYQNFNYAVVNNESIEITGLKNNVENVIIPSTIRGMPVKSIGYSAFSGCTSLTSITMPASVTTIGDSAFANCTSLTGITIPAGVTSIGSYAFSGCTKITNITLPGNITTIGYSAFANCTSLTAITIPAGVAYVDSYAFSGCNNLTITIQRASVPLGWGYKWHGDRPVIFTVPGGCGLTHVTKYEQYSNDYHKLVLCKL